MNRRTMNPFIIAGFLLLLMGVAGTVIPLSTITVGDITATDISPFSALSTVIGLALIVLGMRKRSDYSF